MTPDPDPDPDVAAEAADRTSAQVSRARLRGALAPRATVRQIVVGLLFVALGFTAVAVTQARSGTGLLVTAREDEVVRVLDDLTERQTRLELEQRSLETQRDSLLSGSDEQRLAASQARVDALAILAGSVAATGPGIRIVISDSHRDLDFSILLNAVQELRDAGAEAISLGDVRVVAATWFADAPDGDGVVVSGSRLRPPYRLRVVGDPATLATALEIPGGVSDSVRTAGGSIAVSRDASVLVSALQPLTTPQYARPAADPSPGS